MLANQNIKDEVLSNSEERLNSDDLIVNNIKNEPAVEFLCILPPFEVKTEKFEFENQNYSKEEDKIFHCQKCPQSFSKKPYLMTHNQMHKPKVKCQVCFKEIRKRHLLNHQKRHEGIKDFNCDLCPAAFVTKTHLVSHMWVHRNEKKFNCHHCTRGFNTNFHFKQHLLSHSVNPPKFECDSCPKFYSTKKSLLIHMINIHTNKNNFKCDECNFTTKWKETLKKHKTIHTNFRPFSCQTCPRKFRTKADLQFHQDGHKLIKDFECEICGKKFLGQNRLQLHIKLFHGRDLYVIFWQF
jgi:KRAB domain-containing zinc finger protein